jgi:hypothetical protein
VNGQIFAWSSNQQGAQIHVMRAGTYAVTVLNSAGCRATASIRVRTALETLPTISGNVNLCKGVVNRLSVPTGHHYRWSTGDTTSFLNVSTAGKYKVSITDRFGCHYIDSIQIRDVLYPVVDFSYLVNGRTVYFQYLGAASNNLIWNLGNNSDTTHWTNPTITYPRNGTYTVTLLGVNACKDTVKVTKRVIVGPNPTNEIAQLEVLWSPNPTTGLLRLELLNYDLSYNVLITNALGQLIHTQKSVTRQLELNLEEQANGVYFLTIETTKGKIVKRFVLQK